MLMATSMLPCTACVTALTCSAVFPMMGSSVQPMKASGTPNVSDTSWIVSTTNCEQPTEIKMLATMRKRDDITFGVKHDSVIVEDLETGGRFEDLPNESLTWFEMWKTMKATYVNMIAQDVSRESRRTSRCLVPATPLYMVGRTMLVEATIWHVICAEAAFTPKMACLRTIPAAQMDMPSTRSRHQCMEPMRLPLSTSSSPARRHWTLMTCSTDFPRKASMRLPILCPTTTEQVSTEADIT
mmetsp:Transcript_49293/g.110984  ORF Transcript_49293/g.110984 Transcript_49293/m.110984 type:complete len:241 (+) Transcript_49293:343-1065(+)